MVSHLLDRYVETVRYPKFYSGVAARLRSAVIDGDLEALRKEALFCRSWGAELGLLGEFAEAVAEVLHEAPAKRSRSTTKAKKTPNNVRGYEASTAGPPPVAGG